VKRRVLRTCIARGGRLARTTPPCGWRPMSLCWARVARRAAPAVARAAAGQVVHRHRYSTLHLHLAVPVVRDVQRIADATRFTSTAAAVRVGGIRAATTHHVLTLHRESTLRSRQLVCASSTFLRHVRVEVAAAAIAAAPRPARTSMVSPMPSPTVAASARQSLPTREARRSQPPVFVRLTHLRASGAEHALIPPHAGGPTLVWQKAAASTYEAGVDGDGVRAPVRIAAEAMASTPAAVRSTPPPAAVAPQQLREALRLNLIDGAFTERLTDDVMRRVEKRLRIERERRGL
jgi:hypothetical protein